jgi:SAM-dependent methyltransferase
VKTRESGMPEEAAWDSFFDPPRALNLLMPAVVQNDVVEFGCGYGTFTIPAAQRTRGTLHALDIDPEMVALTAAKASQAGLTNVRATVRDFVAEGTGLPPDSAGYAMLFNILHAEQPEILLREAYRVLAPGGSLGIMHWNYDPNTPRGPSMAIRPRPEQCRDWALAAGFELTEPGIVPLPPYHYGMLLRKFG